MFCAARPDEPAVSRLLFLRTVASFRMLDINVEATLSRLGLNISDLADLPERLASSVMHDLWTAVTTVTGRRGVGLRLAALVKTDHFSTFGSVLSASATLGDAFTRGARLFGLLSERQRFVLRIDGRQVVIVLEILQGPPLHTEGIECLIGALFTFARELSGRHELPVEVRFKHDPPPQRSDVEGFFRCPVVFGASENSLSFDSEILLVPIPGHDEARCAALQREGESMLAELREPSTFRRDVAKAISHEIGEGRTGIRGVASRLGMHPKTLARVLRAHGTTYSELLDQVRLTLARSYLERQDIAVAEVAFRLGYSERSAFHRAFKRWTGKAPGSQRPPC